MNGSAFQIALRVGEKGGPPIISLETLLRRGLAIVGLIVITALLAGCGALIDTRLLINQDSSGSRVMTATLPSNQVSALSGGVEAAANSIRSRLPATLDFGGLVENAGGSLTATFALNFESPKDYVSKAKSILEAAGRSDVNIDFIVSESTLRTGLAISEDFSSYDLLSWMFDGLVADGVVSASDRSNSYELGDSVVIFRGQEIPSRFASISASLIEDFGFDEITMETDIVSPSSFNREINFEVSEKKFEENAGRYEEFFSSLMSSGLTATPSGPGIWKLNLSGDAETVANLTDAVFGSNGSTFEVSLIPTGESPTSVRLLLSQSVDCSSLCATGTDVTDSVRGAALSPGERKVIASSAESANFSVVPPFETVAATVAFGLFGSVQATTEFEIKNQYFDFIPLDRFEALLSPPVGAGELIASATDRDTTLLTVTVRGQSLEDFGLNFAAWSPGSRFDQIEPESANLLNQAKLYSFDFGFASIVKDHRILNLEPLVVSLPVGVSLGIYSNGVQEAVQAVDGTLSIPWSGRIEFMTSGSLVNALAAGALGLALLAVVAFAYLRRNSLHRWYQAVKPSVAKLALTILAKAKSLGVTRPHLSRLVESKSKSNYSGPRASLLGLPNDAPFRPSAPRDLLLSQASRTTSRKTRNVSLLTQNKPTRVKTSFGYVPEKQK